MCRWRRRRQSGRRPRTATPSPINVCRRRNFWVLQGVATRNPLEIYMEELYWTGGAGRPWSRTRSYDVEPRPASAEGTLPDVRGRLEGSYRHRVVCCCRSGMDLTTNAIGFLMTYAGR